MLLLLLLLLHSTYAFSLSDAFQKIQKDYQALSRRVTARHILVANSQIATALQQTIRSQCLKKERYIVDVFEEAARKYSQDETTSQRGGLLGTLVPQGYCICERLDRACFEISLGNVAMIESDYGHHLVLVTERTNCPKLDGDKTLLMQLSSKNVFGTLVVPPSTAQSSKNNSNIQPAQMLLDQAAFWLVVMLAGGIVAELASKIIV